MFKIKAEKNDYNTVETANKKNLRLKRKKQNKSNSLSKCMCKYKNNEWYRTKTIQIIVVSRAYSSKGGISRKKTKKPKSLTKYDR